MVECQEFIDLSKTGLEAMGYTDIRVGERFSQSSQSRLQTMTQPEGKSRQANLLISCAAKSFPSP